MSRLEAAWRGRVAGCELRVGGTWLEAMNLTAHTRLLRRPRFRGDVQLLRSFSDRFELGAGVSAVAQREDVDARTYRVIDGEDYVVARLHAAWRLNSAVTNLGVQNELDVISAAVIGGTSFAGGIGTITGAVLGAVVMQSLRSGMMLLRIDSPSQDIVVGVILVMSVGIDAALRIGRRRSAAAALAIGLVVAAIIIQTGRQ